MRKRIFTLFLAVLLCITGGEMDSQAKRPLSSYSTRSYNWGLGQNLNHKNQTEPDRQDGNVKKIMPIIQENVQKRIRLCI